MVPDRPAVTRRLLYARAVVTVARLCTILLSAVLGMLVLAPPTLAKSPPTGKYGCTIEGLLFGSLKIVDKNSYKRNGKKGSYKAGDKKISFPDGFEGYKIRFDGGSFDDFKGRWYKADSGVSEIALESPEDGFENIYCDEETARAKRACNTINLGGPKVFAKVNMRCETAKRYAKRLYKSDGEDEPRNFTCSSGSNFNEGASCSHETKDKFFGWHPAD